MVEMKEIGIEGGGMGFFACGDFSCGKIIAIYIGAVIDEGVNRTYSVTNGSIVFNCKPWSKGAPGESYLRARVANNPSWKGGGEGECEGKSNAIIGHAFTYIATKDIDIGDEILLDYDLTS